MKFAGKYTHKNKMYRQKLSESAQELKDLSSGLIVKDWLLYCPHKLQQVKVLLVT